MIQEKIKQLITYRTNSILGIDVGTSSVKIVEIGWRKKGFVLKNIGIVQIPEGVIVNGCITDSEKLLTVLNKLLATSGVNCNDAVIAISGKNIFVRELLFPVMTEKELREAIKWDLEKYVPYAPETYYFDFAALPHYNDEQEMKVLLVAAPKDNVDVLIDVVKKLGLHPLAVDIEALALYRTLECGENSMVINIGSLASHINIFRNGSPIVTRYISIGGQRFTEVIMKSLDLDVVQAEKVKLQQNDVFNCTDIAAKQVEINKYLELLVSELVREIRRTIEYYQIQNKDAVVDKIFISGGGARLGKLMPCLSQHINLPVSLHNPLSLVDIPESFDKCYINDIAPQLASAVGLALGGGEIHVNLLPLTERRPKYPLTRIFISISVVLLVVLFSNYAYGLYNINSMERQLHSLENKYQLLYPTQQKMVENSCKQQLINNKNNVLINLNKGRVPWYAIVNHLGTLTPEEVRLTEVSSTGKNSVSLKGTARSYPDIANFMQLLEQDSVFSEPVLVTADTNIAIMMENFIIIVELKEM